ncbi:LCP family protein [Arsenicicoccus sp. oral taxon 190]|uniref:LCP family protein n=1 Tax=Arsenicicoccus sp. oral taxon 190 TaxID=1658671 RepID=UPI00067DBD9A|nr:LCP family protein [Arsenicicoccus sp. oral taxon 190]
MADHDDASRTPATPGDPGADHATRPGQGDQDLTRRELRARKAARRRPVLRAIVISLVVLLAAVLGLGAYAVLRFNGNIKALDIQSNLLRPKSDATTDPTSGHTAMNILLMGVDSRAGANAGYGNADDARSGERSDTTMLVHLAADRRSAVVVSIPRDTMMPAPPRNGQRSGSSGAASTATTSSPAGASATATPPGCNIDAPSSEWKAQQFNSNIEEGGVTCVIATVMHNTGLNIDHVMTVDFTGFKQIVDAMGTVEICTTKPVKDQYSGLDLPAGRHQLDGEEALAFVRTRHGVGDGSDIGRMRLQQDFAAAVVRKATSTGVLLNPGKLYGVLDAATKSLTTDPQIANVSALSSLAGQLRELKPANVRFITAPTETYKPNPDRLQLSPAAQDLWTLLREDKPWPTAPAATASASATPTVTPTVAPSAVSVAIENAAGTDGLGTQVSRALTVQGFRVTRVASAAAPSDGVVVHHSASQMAAAQEVALAFPGATLKADGKAGQAVTVSVGRGAPAVVLVPNREGAQPLPAQPLKAAPVPGSSASPTLQAKAASDDVCSDTSKG